MSARLLPRVGTRLRRVRSQSNTRNSHKPRIYLSWVGSTALGRPLSNTSLASQSSFADPFSERLSEGAQPYPLQLHDVPLHSGV